MRVAHVTATFPPYLGGTGNVAYQHARLLHALGHHVTVFTASTSGALENFPFHVQYLPCALRCGNASLTPNLVTRLRAFDLIHVHYPYIFGAEFALMAARIGGIPSVISYHNELRDSHPVKACLFSVYNRLSEPRLLALANRILAVRMDHLLSIHPNLTGEPRVTELGHGVDTSHFHPIPQELARAQLRIPTDVPVVLFVGALDKAHRFKNVEGLLNAFACPGARNALLLIAGDGDLRAQLERLAVKLGIGGQTRFLGRQTPDRLPLLYSAADVTVLPSTSVESFGLVQVESLACGTPVIASDLPGVRTIVEDGIDGFLVPPGDQPALVAAIQRVCENRRLAHRMGEAGREKVGRLYGWEQIGLSLESIYREMVAR